MQTYLVGGAVRDLLLGLEIKDRDWVVVGADAQTMLDLGFRPVGKDFPVFLHPETCEEYALARTERKTAKGYAGFAFHADKNITLEQDLLRRDLTINAIAQTPDGRIIDPYNGRQDLEQGILRHVSAAFAEDPVRILRTARFAARYGFDVAPETMSLMRDMVAQGEADALVPERVWQEFAKGLMERFPERMLAILHESRALNSILPELDARLAATLPVLRQAVRNGLDLPGRYAAMLHAVPLTQIQGINRRWRIPKHCAELAELATQWQDVFGRIAMLDDDEVLDALKRADGLRRPERFQAALDVCATAAQAGGRDYPQRRHWQTLLAAAKDIDTAAIAAQHRGNPQETAQAISRARLMKIKVARTA